MDHTTMYKTVGRKKQLRAEREMVVVSEYGMNIWYSVSEMA